MSLKNDYILLLPELLYDLVLVVADCWHLWASDASSDQESTMQGVSNCATGWNDVTSAITALKVGR